LPVSEMLCAVPVVSFTVTVLLATPPAAAVP
jgi:hypothetical protein